MNSNLCVSMARQAGKALEVIEWEIRLNCKDSEERRAYLAFLVHQHGLFNLVARGFEDLKAQATKPPAPPALRLAV